MGKQQSEVSSKQAGVCLSPSIVAGPCSQDDKLQVAQGCATNKIHRCVLQSASHQSTRFVSCLCQAIIGPCCLRKNAAAQVQVRKGARCSVHAGLHTDRVFLGGGSERLLTVWIPFQAVRPEAGSVLVCRGSHRCAEPALSSATPGISRSRWRNSRP